uniref:host cell division inhibitor Icd-like protein n=1 Tax=Salmonella sp. TaxID=599 RepID=UPI0029816BE4|nr:host cell division inhibitor Icd-like protein [Salmonella sp.]
MLNLSGVSIPAKSTCISALAATESEARTYLPKFCIFAARLILMRWRSSITGICQMNWVEVR